MNTALCRSLAAALASAAAAWPAKPIRLSMPFSAGGGSTLGAVAKATGLQDA